MKFIPMKRISMKPFILIFAALSVQNAYGQTRCQQVGGFTYCDNGYTIQDLGGQQIIRQRETIQPDPVRPITIDPYSEQYYPRLDRQESQFPRYPDPYRY